MAQSDLLARLARQSLRRPLTAQETALSEALLGIFAAGEHDFVRVAAALEERRVARPSGKKGAWTPETLEAELAQINASLDAAYAANDLM